MYANDQRERYPATAGDLELLDRYWQAANYLSVGQIYLLDNPLLREPLRVEHVKPRLLGHWGTTPGLNFIYAHLNRVIRARDLDMHLCLRARPRRARAWSPTPSLEGTYSEIYPDVGRDARGSAPVCSASSPSPAASPATSAPETPGSIHEGGELGYALVHAYGAAFDNPDLIVACVVGDGEAETGPLAAAWHSQQVPQPRARRRGAADPAPQRLQDRQSDRARAHRRRRARAACFAGYGYEPHLRRGRRAQRRCTRRWRRRWTTALDAHPRHPACSARAPATVERGRAGR